MWRPDYLQTKKWGELKVTIIIMPIVTPYSVLELLNDVPLDQKTSEIFAELAKIMGTAVYQWSLWPEKPA